MKQKNKPFLLFIQILLAFLYNSCNNECENQGYTLSFYFTDEKSGKPYYEVSHNSPDSLKIYFNSLSYPPLELSKRFDGKKGNIFGGLTPNGNKTDTLYIYFSKSDMDTLLINSLVTHIEKECNQESYLYTATYKGKAIQISTDTLHSDPVFNLAK